MIAGIIIGVIALIIVIFLIGTYNGLVGSRNQVEEAFSTMDVYLKKRYDLIPNLVETVKGYATHEKETLEKVIQARNSAVQAKDAADVIRSNEALGQSLRGIFALAENYPELKANTSFLDLQQQLRQVEEDIANARKYYNGCVKAYNDKTMMFPSNIVANMFGFKRASMYEVADAAERENVKVSF
ncbi:MAG: LemA family protein [Bilifractor sp.]